LPVGYGVLANQDNAGLLTQLPDNRYQIGNGDKLTYNADGSLVIYLQADSPGRAREANWLPAPRDKDFKVTIRIYSPAEGEWLFTRLNRFPPVLARMLTD
jgi:hypothetical protein